MPPSTETSIVDLAELAKYDTATICNVIELFDARPHNTGYMNQHIHCCFEKMPPMVGYACTSTYRSAAAPPAGSATKQVADQLELFADLPGSAIMVIQDLDEPLAAASFGDLLCNTYKAFGASGLISSGAGRDLSQVQAIGFPVFVGSTMCSHGYGHIPTIGKPVQVGGITVHQGDLLHGDRDGVTTIPCDIAPLVSQVAGEYVAAEKVVLNYVTCTSNPTRAGYQDAVMEMVRLFNQIKERIATSTLHDCS